MSKIINVGETRSIVAKSKSYSGAYFNLNLTHATANTAFVDGDLNLDNMRITVRLTQNAKTTIIANDRASILCRESSFDNSLYPSTRNAWVAQVVYAAGVYGIYTVPLYIDFGGVININKGDEIEVEVSLNDGIFSANVNSGASNGIFGLIEAQGVQYGFETIETYSVPPGESLFALDAGDNIQRVTFVNADKFGVTSAFKVLDSVSISGADWQLSVTNFELQNLRAQQFEAPLAEVGLRYQTFKIYEGEDLDSVSINMNLIPANVNAGKNAVVVRRFHTCEKTIKTALVREQKDVQKAMAKVVPSRANVRQVLNK